MNKFFKAIVVCCFCVLIWCLVGCNAFDKSSNGQFYSLNEAYELDLISKEQLNDIAGKRYKNEINIIDDRLDQKIQREIKKCYLSDLKQIAPSATIDDVIIKNYYGQYGDCFVVQIVDSYTDFPAVELECIVAGVVIRYSGPDIIVWIKNDK